MIGAAASEAVGLVLGGDGELWRIVATSLQVSLTAAVVAFIVGAPLGAVLAVRRFPGRSALLVLCNALLGLPPVVVGLVTYLALSRAGPLGSWGLLFTVEAMIVAQILLALPIVVALTHRTAEVHWAEYGDALRVDGAGMRSSVAMLLAIGGGAAVTTFLAAFGRAIAEVGAIMMVGGNIRGETRTMTTAIVLETSKGNLALALGLGLILVALTLLVSAAAFVLTRRQAH
jgi:tungstate transport system permease protein